ncbi:hypothetical protein FHV99_004641 [Ochrobactrum sp. P20RRXII]|nr:hypothetical protein [Ochrobactrum sp. P20RRXII]NIH77389.1 hypothetical protein [Ochrobactrum sp. P20RRXII]
MQINLGKTQLEEFAEREAELERQIAAKRAYDASVAGQLSVGILASGVLSLVIGIMVNNNENVDSTFVLSLICVAVAFVLYLGGKRLAAGAD